MEAQRVYDRGKWPKFYFTRGGLGGIRRKTYLSAVGGKLPTNFLPYSDVGHTDEAKKELMKITGVGVKVADCALLYGLHRLDGFPLDVWMKRVLENEYPGGYPFEAYSPYNGIYQQYMFLYYREMGKAA